jgi:hypothetical protein
VPAVITEVSPFPNPFLSKNSGQLNFCLPSAFDLTKLPTTASLYIFSSSLDKVFSSDLPIEKVIPFFASGVKWDGKCNNGNEIATGVYFFVLKVGENEFKGKFSAIRE